MSKFWRKWFKIGAGAGVGILTIIGLFSFLVSYYGFEITGTDDLCSGTLDDPCISFVNVTNPTKYNVDVFNQDEIELSFSPEIPDYKIFRKDGRCSGKTGSSCCSPDGVCLKGWKFTDFTPATRPLEDKVYVQRFPAYSTVEFLVWGLKESPTDRVKWDFTADPEGLSKGYLDPVWDYDSSKGGDGSLVLHLKMEGDATDSSNSGNDGTISGASLTKGKYGLAYDFDGDDYIQVTDDPSLDGMTAITISGWMRTNYQMGYNSYPLSKGNGCEGKYSLRIGGSTPTLNALNLYRIYNSSGGWSNCSYSVNTVGYVNDGDWHHFVFTANGTIAKAYLDGDLRDTGACVFDVVQDSANALRLGDTNFNGVLDDVRIYNRSINASEVRELYNESLVSNSIKLYGNSTHNISNSIKLYGNSTHNISNSIKFYGNAQET